MSIIELSGIKDRPIKILAPMVGNSDLAYRTLARRYGADICYTEMVHCKHFLSTKSSPTKNRWYTTNNDEPSLVIQIAGNDPIIMLEASKKLQMHCKAIDINFGCPQNIAKRGFYGSFLQNDLELTSKIIQTLSHSLEVPIFCKIRIFEEDSKTLDYCRIIENSGCKTLAVHGRTREQKGVKTGLANWDIIRNIKSIARIPIISNGNILYASDIQKCYEYTKCDGVMVAESHLYNPLIFCEENKSCFEILYEYLNICKEVKTNSGEIKSHIYKILHQVLDEKHEYKPILAATHSLDGIINLVTELESSCNMSFYGCTNRIRRHPLIVSTL